jgi:hypothetical protein
MFALALLLWAGQSPDSALVASFSVLRSASARFRQDLQHASAQLVASRAQQVRAACTGSRNAADALAARDSAPRAELAALLRVLVSCQRDWETNGTRANADSLRAWGPFRLSELERALRRYQIDHDSRSPR